jgi:L-asparaginase/Glu-tRNA(Gln) amidotransferase subunit D
VRVAASKEARGCGVLADIIHASRDVSTAFASTGSRTTADSLGTVGPDGQVALHRRPARLHTRDTEFDVAHATGLPRVEIVYSHAEAGREEIDAFVAAGAAGIVVAGYATGRPAPSQLPALEAARKEGVHVFLSTRGRGALPNPTASPQSLNFVTADDLNPQKARVLAMLALARTRDVGLLQAMFARY